MSVSRFDEALAYNPEFAKLPEELRKSILEHIRMHYSKEHALRKELESHPDVSIKNCAFEGENSDGSKAFEFELLEGGLNKLTKINLDGWLCYGPSVENPIDALQQRLTVAEHRADELQRQIDILWKEDKWSQEWKADKDFVFFANRHAAHDAHGNSFGWIDEVPFFYRQHCFEAFRAGVALKPAAEGEVS